MSEKKTDKKIEETENKSNPISRRTFLKVAGAGVGAIALTASIPGLKQAEPIGTAQAAPPILKKLTPYVDRLVIPPLAVPIAPNTYAITITQGTAHKFHRDLPPTATQSYFSTPPAADFHYLGPTIVAQSGTPVTLTVTNNLGRGVHQLSAVMDYTIMGNTKDGSTLIANRWVDEHRTCVHLHGGKVEVPSDGGPRDWFSPLGSPKVNPYPEGAPIGANSHTYNYPNDQPSAMIWYHDHAWGITRFNPFLGQAGAYVIRDPYEEDLIAGTNLAGRNVPLQKLPSAGYEVPIVIQDKLLDLATGAMIYPPTPTPGLHPVWIPEYFGNTPVINGKAYPFVDIEPRRYRLRFLNGSNARFYNIYFQGSGAGNLPIWVIGSEQGFLPTPVMVNSLVLGPGERYDTIVDFTGIKLGATLTLKNNAKAPYPGGRGGEIPELMQFNVINPVTVPDTTTLPAALTLPPIDQPLIPTLTTPRREIVLSEVMDPTTGQPFEALLDGQNFDASFTTPLITENDGATSIWQFINTTGDAHPMHIHLVKFQIVDRQPFDVKRFLAAWNAWILLRDPTTRPSVNAFLLGAPTPPAPEETGWKDTAKAMPGEVLRVIAKFDLPATAAAGLHKYVCHCHILEHEENDMMFYFGVQKP